MKGWLNKPPAVAILAIFAIGVIYFNVIRPLLGPSHAPVTELSSQEAEITDGTGPNDEVDLDHSPVADWKTLSMLAAHPSGRTDPFRPYVPSTLPDRTDGYDAPHVADTPALPDFPAIRAIVFGPALKYAMIGNKMVQEGDHINNYLIVKIRENTIILQGSSGNVKLRFDKQQEDED